MATQAFKLNERSLECPGLESSHIFLKLRSRLMKFFVVAEKYRLNGPTKK